MISEIIEALILGMLAAVTLIYTFQTRVAYPDWLLQAYEHPWIFVCVLIVAIVLFGSSPKISAFIMLLLIALWMDWLLFARATNVTNVREPINIRVPPKNDVAEVWPYDSTTSKTRRPFSDNPGYPKEDPEMPYLSPSYPTFQFMDDMVYGPAPV